MATIVQQTNGEKTIYTADEYTLVQAKLNDIYNTQLPGKANATDLATTNAQLADNAQQVELFGAVGDGVTSDSHAFQNAINQAITTRFPAIKLQHGKTYLLKYTDVQSFSGVSIIGNGATLSLNGNVTFNIQNLAYFHLSDLTILTDQGLTEDATSQSAYQMFFYTDLTKNVLYDIQRLNIKSTASQTPKIARYPYFMQTAYAQRGSVFKDLTFENMGNPIIVTNGDHFTIDRVDGINIETLVYVKAGSTFTVKNIRLVNTQPQTTTWICKNNGTASNGKDTLLMESPCDHIIVENIYGEFCIERVIYCQGSNVYANNLLAVNCQAFKFCGTNSANAKSNVTVRNLTKNVTDDMTFDVTKTYQMLDMYYLTNVDVENVYFNNYRSDKLTSVGGYFFSLLDGLNHVTINNVFAEINTNQPFVYSTANIDATQTLTDIKIKNVQLTQYGDTTGTNLLFGFGSAAPTNWINGLRFENVTVENDDTQIINKDVSRFVGDLFSKKAIGIVLLNIDCGYLSRGNTSVDQNSSSFVSDNISKFKMTHRFKSNGGSDNYECAYYSGYASGGSEIFIPLCSNELQFYPYYLHSNYNDSIILDYENITTNAVRLYDSIKSCTFNVLMDTVTSWNLPINTTGFSYMVEVMSSLGYGKAIISGSTVTVINTSLSLTFDSTASKLQVKPVAGSGTDYYININNATGTGARVKVIVTKL